MCVCGYFLLSAVYSSHIQFAFVGRVFWCASCGVHHVVCIMWCASCGVHVVCIMWCASCDVHVVCITWCASCGVHVVMHQLQGKDITYSHFLAASLLNHESLQVCGNLS